MAQATEIILNFALTTGASSNTDYIDLNQCLSMVNRKLERQGRQVAISSIELSGDGTSNVYVYALPSAWYAVNAWVKAYKLWRKMQNEAKEEHDVTAKWHDFKIGMDEDHMTHERETTYGTLTGFNANLLPVGFQDPHDPVVTGLTEYSWEASKITMPNQAVVPALSFPLYMVGPTVLPNGYGIIQGYGQSRQRVQSVDPNYVVGSDSWMLELFDDGENMEEVAENLAEENRGPPYLIGNTSGGGAAEEWYPGGGNNADSITTWLMGKGLLQGSSSGIRSYIAGFTANCGLLKITNTANTGSVSMKITLVDSGKGALTRSMLEAN